MYSWHGFNDNL
jgi:hypothetical protein